MNRTMDIFRSLIGCGGYGSRLYYDNNSKDNADLSNDREDKPLPTKYKVLLSTNGL